MLIVEEAIWRGQGELPRRSHVESSGRESSDRELRSHVESSGQTHRGSTVGLLLLQRFRVSLLWNTRLVSSQWWILIYNVRCLIHWWAEILHADRTTSMCIWTTAEPSVRLLQRKTGLIHYWPFQCDASVVVYSNRHCSSAFCLFLTYCLIYLGYPYGHLLGKSSPLGFSLVQFLF